jgi:hypothetical protein
VLLEESREVVGNPSDNFSPCLTAANVGPGAWFECPSTRKARNPGTHKGPRGVCLSTVRERLAGLLHGMPQELAKTSLYIPNPGKGRKTCRTFFFRNRYLPSRLPNLGPSAHFRQQALHSLPYGVRYRAIAAVFHATFQLEFDKELEIVTIECTGCQGTVQKMS